MLVVDVVDVADDGVDDDVLVGQPLLVSGRDRQAEQPGELGSRLGVAEVGRDHHGPRQVATAEVPGQLRDGGEMVDRNAEEAVHLRGVQRHREYPVRARRRDEIGDQLRGDGDPAGVLLVRTRVRVVRDHGGHLRRRCAARAASSIISNSTRCSWTGGTSGCTM